MEKRRHIFEGVKVADFGWVATAPCAVRHLVEHGATSIKVESVAFPDGVRAAPAPTKGGRLDWNANAMFNMYSPGRYSLALNLRSLRGVEVARKVIAWADIMIENKVPGTMERLGVGYEEAKKVNPGIIYCAATAAGDTGPLRQSTGLGSYFQGPCGVAHLWGWPDRLPIGSPIPYTDFFNFQMVGFALMAALDYKRRTGEGQFIDFSQIECTGHQVTLAVLDYVVNGRVQCRQGNRHAYACPHGIFPCRGNDLWVAIAVFTDEEWRAFCEVMGNPLWAQDPMFATFASRKENEDELERLIGEWTMHYDRYEVMHRLQAAGVAAMVVQSGRDLYYDPQLKHRHFYWRLNHPSVGWMNCEAHAYKLSKTPIEVKRAPLLGEHNEFICKEILGISDKEYEELVAAKVVETYPLTLELLKKGVVDGKSLD